MSGLVKSRVNNKNNNRVIFGFYLYHYEYMIFLGLNIIIVNVVIILSSVLRVILLIA